MDTNYFESRDKKTVEKTRQLLKTLPDYVTEFLVGIQMRTTTLTRLGYVRDIKTFLNYLLTDKFDRYTDVRQITLADLEQLKAFDLELYLDYLSTYTVNGKEYRSGEHAKERKLSALRTFFKYMYKKERLSCNIAEKVDMPKIHDKPILYLEVDETAKLLDLVDDAAMPGTARQKSFAKKTRERDLALLTLFLGTGMRISECVGLNLNDIDLSRNAVRITRKGGNMTTLYFSDEVKGALTDYLNWRDREILNDTDMGRALKDTPALFVSLKGTRISVRAVEMLVKKYAAAVNPLKKITPHKLRSTYGTTLYRETQDIYLVADVLGHSDINTTKRHYAAISEELRKGAASAIKLREKPDDK